MALVDLLKPPVESVFRLLFTYECVGEEHVPASGPAVVAANHPSYLDPVLLSLQVRRPIRFMAADFLFRVPLLGTIIRAFGAFPVDTRRGKGREAYDRAKALVEAGQVVGVFPEGKRSRTGWMEASLREGAARLSWQTGAPLVPATITGAFRAWPHYQSLPRPARVRVRFHPPIDPGPYRGLPEDAALGRLLAEVRARVEGSLLPGVKADLRKEVLYRTEAPPPRVREVLPAAVALILAVVAGEWGLGVVSVAFLAYVVVDWRLVPQSRLAKWVRTGSPLLFGLAGLPSVARALDAPPPAAPAALWAIALGSAFPYLYARTRTALAFVRGWTLALGAEAVALAWYPAPAGAHLALPLFATLFAVARRTVFWPYVAGALAGYVGLVGVLLQPDPPVLAVHLAAGAAGWLAGLLLPYHPRLAPRNTVR